MVYECMCPPLTHAGHWQDQEGEVTGEIEIPNLSDENEVEEVDVSQVSFSCVNDSLSLSLSLPPSLSLSLSLSIPLLTRS